MDFPEVEQEVLRLWQDLLAFETQLALTKGSKEYVLFDGPPFATGLPHYGHLLTGTIKDAVGRYWSAKGYHVERRFGWDTHGVPIEFEIDKKLGMSGPEAVKKIGIEAYNAECRSIVLTYATEWRQTVHRMGRWVDFDDDFKTMDTNYMESEWWAFKTLFERGDVYRSFQIMPYSTKLCTPLSNFEAAQNYKDMVDPSVVVSFPLLDHEDDNTSLLVWTTTPWTLPSNLAIASHPNLEYVKIQDEATHKNYVLLESRLLMLYKDVKTVKFNILARFEGKDMAGWRYKPMFEYFAEDYQDCFKIINAAYVQSDNGTGLVHIAPAFGPEDYDAATAAGLISSTRLPPSPVDQHGCFTSEVSDYAGQYVKDAEKAIIKHLKEIGRLVVNKNLTHSVKFCWRSDTPLINKAISTWFIKVTNDVPNMLENLKPTIWVPNFVKEKRFGNWLANARDWSVSRNRFWGTPLPLWVSDDFSEVVCVGSIQELRDLSGYKGELTNLHRDVVDGITIPSQKGNGLLHRVEEVFDTWFESGCMPFASRHYPFENADDFLEKWLPGDFVGEGLDQTRGWFYTTTVLSTKLFNRPPFKNAIVNGMILAEDGKKMSKRLKNYPEPTKIIDAYSADALRAYMISSPVVRAETLNFKESGVKEVVTKVLLPLWNSYRYFAEQAMLLKKVTGTAFIFDPKLSSLEGRNVMDRWILSSCQGFLEFINQEMAAYRLYTVLPRMRKMIENLTNWYIHCNRKRLKGRAGLGEDDTFAAVNTLFEALFTIVRALCPFMPFITEHIYQLLRPYISDSFISAFPDSRSVHFLPFPEPNPRLLDPEVEHRIETLQRVIELGRTARDRCTVGFKTPLSEVVILADDARLAELKDLLLYVKEELNVRTVHLSRDEDRFGIRFRAIPDWQRLGKKYKKAAQGLKTALPALSNQDFRRFLAGGSMEVDGLHLGTDDLSVVRVVVPDSTNREYEPSSDKDFVVLLDRTVDREQMREGLARELVKQMNILRKNASLMPTDDVRMVVRVLADPAAVDLPALMQDYKEIIGIALMGYPEVHERNTHSVPLENILIEESLEIDGLRLAMVLAKVVGSNGDLMS